MPSTVVISWPSASAASIRQETTGAPSSEDGAGAAAAALADGLGAGQVELVAQRLEQRDTRLDAHAAGRAVHLQAQRDGVRAEDARRGFAALGAAPTSVVAAAETPADFRKLRREKAGDSSPSSSGGGGLRAIGAPRFVY